MSTERPTTPDQRWISVIFLQGEEAEIVLGMIDRSGPRTASQYLTQRDHGKQTTNAALTNGYVYDRIPERSTDRTYEHADSPYALTYSTQFHYVSLLRRYPVDSDKKFAPPPSTQPARHVRHRADIWQIAARDRAANLAGHTVTQ